MAIEFIRSVKKTHPIVVPFMYVLMVSGCSYFYIDNQVERLQFKKQSIELEIRHLQLELEKIENEIARYHIEPGNASSSPSDCPGPGCPAVPIPDVVAGQPPDLDDEGTAAPPLDGGGILSSPAPDFDGGGILGFPPGGILGFPPGGSPAY